MTETKCDPIPCLLGAPDAPQPPALQPNGTLVTLSSIPLSHVLHAAARLGWQSRCQAHTDMASHEVRSFCICMH